MAKVGINGFGRIGRTFLRAALENDDIEVNHVNDPFINTDYMIYLFKYDSVHGTFAGTVGCEDNTVMIINERKITTSCEKDPSKINWSELNVKYVVEATGVFTDMDKAQMHLQGGATRVIITAPSPDAPTFVYGVNHRMYNPQQHGSCVSAASCTTNCAAPIVRLMHDNYEVEEAMVTAIHAVTAHQKIVDGPTGKLWRYGRNGLQNIIPTSTGAAKCIARVIPELKNKISAIAFHVPVPNVSVCDMTFRVARPTTYEGVKHVMRDASEAELKGVLGYTEDDCVSSDFNHTRFSCIFDSKAAIPLTSTFVKVVAWYDNEYGYACRIVDLLVHIKDLDTGKVAPVAGYSPPPRPSASEPLPPEEEITEKE